MFHSIHEKSSLQMQVKLVKITTNKG